MWKVDFLLIKCLIKQDSCSSFFPTFSGIFSCHQKRRILRAFSFVSPTFDEMTRFCLNNVEGRWCFARRNPRIVSWSVWKGMPSFPHLLRIEYDISKWLTFKCQNNQISTSSPNLRRDFFWGGLFCFFTWTRRVAKIKRGILNLFVAI